MLIPGGTAAREVTRDADHRMTLPQRPGAAPPEQILGRGDFAVVPWIVVSVVSLGIAVSEILRVRHGSVDWLIVGLGLVVSAATGVLAVIQDRSTGRRFRQTMWVYALGSTLVLAALAALAIHNRGVSSMYYAGVLPLAAYRGLVFPPRLRPWTLVGLLVATVGIQVLNDATLLFDTVVMWALIVTCWFSGVLVHIGHARTARIARGLASYDRLARTLNRRGFLRQLERSLGPATDYPNDPIALLLVNLNGFRALNESGEAAGDELLHWVGTTFPSALPDTAELGRLGNDEFGVLLPATTRVQAEAVAQSIRAYLHERTEVTIGVATSETRRVAPADLFRVADAARVFAKREGLGIHVLVAGSARVAGRRDVSTGPEGERPLSYASIRSTGKVPRIVEQGVLYSKLIRRALLLVAASGVVIVGREWLGDDHGVYPDLVRYVGPVFIAWNLALAGSTLRFTVVTMPRFELFMLVNSTGVLAIGVGITALATGGLTAPIGAALFVKLIFDASMVPPRRALLSGAILMSGWVMVAILSPATTLWVIPFHLALFAGSLALGSIGYRAAQQAGEYTKSLAVTDSLTLLPNRIGFRQLADAAFVRSATETGAPFGVLSFQITGFKVFNETFGYAAGDSVLCDLAELLQRRLPDHHVIGRTGANEFLAAVPVSGTLPAMRLAEELAREIRAVLGVNAYAAHATCPEDAATVGQLLEIADRRLQDLRQSDARRSGVLRSRDSGGAHAPRRAAL